MIFEALYDERLSSTAGRKADQLLKRLVRQSHFTADTLMRRKVSKHLRKYGGEDQYQILIEKSQYAALEVAASEALDQLIKEFPDENRRPYGEKTLRDTLECPIGSRGDPWRIIDKIRNRSWTEYDLARIEGRPDPSEVPPFEPFICSGKFVAVDVETANSKRPSFSK